MLQQNSLISHMIFETNVANTLNLKHMPINNVAKTIIIATCSLFGITFFLIFNNISKQSKISCEFKYLLRKFKFKEPTNLLPAHTEQQHADELQKAHTH